jgi:S-adenosylmethionine-diacylgycerolhomoserine-N-methlytransferase
MEAHGAAENMDQMYRYQRYIYDLTRRYYLLGRDPLIKGLAARPGDTIVEVACGTARNLLHAADRYPWSFLYGVDISNQMLMTARQSIDQSGHAGRVRLAMGDASDLDLKRSFNLDHADRIFVSYAVSMIPDWERALESALAHLAPGGELHIVDFGPMSRMPSPARTALRAWLARFGVMPRLELGAICRDMAERRGLVCNVRESATGYWITAVIRAPRGSDESPNVG